MAEPDKMLGTCQFFFSTFEKDLQSLKTTQDRLNHHVEAVKSFAKLYNYNYLMDGEQVKSNSVKQSWNHLLISTMELILNISEPPSCEQLQELILTLESVADNRNEPMFLKLLTLLEKGPWSQPCLKMLIEKKKIDSKQLSEMLEDDGNIKRYLDVLEKAFFFEQAVTLAVAILIHPTMKVLYQGTCQMSLMVCLDENEISQHMKHLDLDVTLKILSASVEKEDVGGLLPLCNAAFYYVLDIQDLSLTEDLSTCWYKMSILHSNEEKMFSKIVKELLPTKINTVPQCIILAKALWKSVPTSSRITCVEILHHALHLLSPESHMKEGILSSIIYMLPNSHIARSCAFTNFLENPSIKHYFLLSNMFKVEYDKHVDIAKDCSAQLRVQLLTYLQQRWPPELPASVDWVWGPLRDFCFSLLQDDDVNYIKEIESKTESRNTSTECGTESDINSSDLFTDTNLPASSSALESDSSDNDDVNSQHEEKYKQVNIEMKEIDHINVPSNVEEVKPSFDDIKESQIKAGNDVIIEQEETNNSVEEESEKEFATEKEPVMECTENNSYAIDEKSDPQTETIPHQKTEEAAQEIEAREITEVQDSHLISSPTQVAVSPPANKKRGRIPKSSKSKREKKLRKKSTETEEKPWRCPVEVCSRDFRAKRGMSHHLTSVHKWLQTEVKGFYQSLSFKNDASVDQAATEEKANENSITELLRRRIEHNDKLTYGSDENKPASVEVSDINGTVQQHETTPNNTAKHLDSTIDNTSYENANSSEQSTNPPEFENLKIAIPVDNKSPPKANHLSQVEPVKDVSVTEPSSNNKEEPVKHAPEVETAKKPAALSIECPVQGCDRTFRHRHTVQAHIEFKHKISTKEATKMAKNAKLSIQASLNGNVANPNHSDVDISRSRGWYWQVDGFLFQDMNQSGNPDLHIFYRRQEANKRNGVARDVMCLLGSAPLSFNLNSTMAYIQEHWQSLAEEVVEAVSVELKSPAGVSPSRTPVPSDSNERFNNGKDDMSPVMDSELFEFNHDMSELDCDEEKDVTPEETLVSRKLNDAKAVMNVKDKYKKTLDETMEENDSNSTQTHFTDKGHFHNSKFNKTGISSAIPTHDGPIVACRKEKTLRAITTQCCDQPIKGVDELTQVARQKESKTTPSTSIPTLPATLTKHRRKSSSSGWKLPHDNIDLSNYGLADVPVSKKITSKVKRKYDTQTVYQTSEKYKDGKNELEFAMDNPRTSFEDALNSSPASNLFHSDKMKARMKRRLSSTTASSKPTSKLPENSTSSQGSQKVSDEIHPLPVKKTKMQKIVMSSANFLTKRSKTGNSALATGKPVETKLPNAKAVNKAGYEELLFQASEQINSVKTDKAKTTTADIRTNSKTPDTSVTAMSSQNPHKTIKRTSSSGIGKRKISLRNLSSTKSNSSALEKEESESGASLFQDSFSTTESNSSFFDSNENISAMATCDDQITCLECGKILSSAFALSCHMRKRHKGHSKKIFIPTTEGHSSTPKTSKNKGSKNGQESPGNAEESDQACYRLTLNSPNTSDSELDDISSLFEDNSDYDSFDGFSPENIPSGENFFNFSTTNGVDSSNQNYDFDKAMHSYRNDDEAELGESESGQEYDSVKKMGKLSNYSKPLSNLSQGKQSSPCLSAVGHGSDHTEDVDNKTLEICDMETTKVPETVQEPAVKENYDEGNTLECELTEEQLVLLPVPYNTIFPSKKRTTPDLSFLVNSVGKFECPVKSCKVNFFNKKQLRQHILRKKSEEHGLWVRILYPCSKAAKKNPKISKTDSQKDCIIRSSFGSKINSSEARNKQEETNPVRNDQVLSFPPELVNGAMEMHMKHDDLYSSDSDVDCAKPLDYLNKDVVEDMSANVRATSVKNEVRMPRRTAYKEANIQMHLSMSPSKRIREMQELTCLYNKRARKRIALALSPAKKLPMKKSNSKILLDDSYGNEETICWLCKAPFLCRRNLTIHIQYHLQQIDRFRHRCNFKGCLYAFHQRNELKTHKLLHNTYVPYICLFCPFSSKTFKTFRKLQLHELFEHQKLKVNMAKLRKQFCITQIKQVNDVRKYAESRTKSKDLEPSFLANGRRSLTGEMCEQCVLESTTTSVATPRVCHHKILETACYVLDDLLWSVSHFSESRSQLPIAEIFSDSNHQKQPQMSNQENFVLQTSSSFVESDKSHQNNESAEAPKNRRQPKELKQNESTCQKNQFPKLNANLCIEIPKQSEAEGNLPSQNLDESGIKKHKRGPSTTHVIKFPRSLRSNPNLCQTSENLCGGSGSCYSEFQQADLLLQLVSQNNSTRTQKKTKGSKFAQSAHILGDVNVEMNSDVVVEENLLKENAPFSGSNKINETSMPKMKDRSLQNKLIESYHENLKNSETKNSLQSNNMNVAKEDKCYDVVNFGERMESESASDDINSSNFQIDNISVRDNDEFTCDNDKIPNETQELHNDFSEVHDMSKFQNDMVLHESHDSHDDQFHHHFDHNHGEVIGYSHDIKDKHQENRCPNHHEQELWKKHVPSYVPCRDDKINMKHQSTYWSNDEDERFRNDIEDVLHHIICNVEVEMQANFLLQNDITPTGVKYYTKRDLDRNQGMGVSVYGYRNLAFCARTLHNMVVDFNTRNESQLPEIPFNFEGSNDYHNENTTYDNMDYGYNFNEHDSSQYNSQFYQDSGATITELTDEMENQIEVNDKVCDHLQQDDVMHFEDIPKKSKTICGSAKPIEDYLYADTTQKCPKSTQAIKALCGDTDFYENQAVDLLSLAKNLQENDKNLAKIVPSTSIPINNNFQSGGNKIEYKSLFDCSAPVIENSNGLVYHRDFISGKCYDMVPFEGQQRDSYNHEEPPSCYIHPDLLFPMRVVEESCYRVHADENFSIFFDNLPECTPVQRDLFCEYSVRSRHNEEAEAIDVCIRTRYPVVSDRERWLSFQCNKFETEADESVDVSDKMSPSIVENSVSDNAEMNQPAENYVQEKGQIERKEIVGDDKILDDNVVAVDENNIMDLLADELTVAKDLPFVGYKKRGRPVKHFDANGNLSSQRSDLTLAEIVAFCDNPIAMENIKNTKLNNNKFTKSVESVARTKSLADKLKQKAERERVREEKRVERLKVEHEEKQARLEKKKKEFELKQEKIRDLKLQKILKYELKLKSRELRRKKSKNKALKKKAIGKSIVTNTFSKDAELSLAYPSSISPEPQQSRLIEVPPITSEMRSLMENLNQATNPARELLNVVTNTAGGTKHTDTPLNKDLLTNSQHSEHLLSKNPQRCTQEVLRIRSKDKNIEISNLFNHDVAVHHTIPTKQAPCFICYVCNKWLGFSAKRFVAHLRHHSMKKAAYPCQFAKQACLHSFNCVKELLVHQYRHSSEKPFPCLFCEKWLKTFKDMRVHRLEQHADILEALKTTTIFYMKLTRQPQVIIRSSKLKSSSSRLPQIDGNARVDRILKTCFTVKCPLPSPHTQLSITNSPSFEYPRAVVAQDSSVKPTTSKTSLVADSNRPTSSIYASKPMADSPTVHSPSSIIPKNSKSLPPDLSVGDILAQLTASFTSNNLIQTKKLNFHGGVEAKSEQPTTSSFDLRRRLAAMLKKRSNHLNLTTESASGKVVLSTSAAKGSSSTNHQCSVVVKKKYQTMPDSKMDNLMLPQILDRHFERNDSANSYSSGLNSMNPPEDTFITHAENHTASFSCSPIYSVATTSANSLAPQDLKGMCSDKTSVEDSTSGKFSTYFEYSAPSSRLLCDKEGIFTSDVTLSSSDSEFDDDLIENDTAPQTIHSITSSASNNANALKEKSDIAQTVYSANSSLQSKPNCNPTTTQSPSYTTNQSLIFNMPAPTQSKSIAPISSANSFSSYREITSPKLYLSDQNQTRTDKFEKPKASTNQKHSWLKKITPKLANALKISSSSIFEMEDGLASGKIQVSKINFDKLKETSTSQPYPLHKVHDIIGFQGKKVVNITKFLNGNSSKNLVVPPTLNQQQNTDSLNMTTVANIKSNDYVQTSRLLKQKRKFTSSFLRQAITPEKVALLQPEKKRLKLSPSFSQFEQILKQIGYHDSAKEQSPDEVLSSLMEPSEITLVDQVWQAKLNHVTRVCYCSNMFNKNNIEITKANIFALYYEVKKFAENELPVDFKIGLECPISTRCLVKLSSPKQLFLHIIQEHSIKQIFCLLKPVWFLNVNDIESENKAAKAKNLISSLSNKIATQKRERVVIRMRKCRFPNCGELISTQNVKSHMNKHAERLHFQNGKCYRIFSSKVILERFHFNRKQLADVEDRRIQLKNDVTCASSLDDEVTEIGPLTLLIDTGDEAVSQTSSANTDDEDYSVTSTNSSLTCNVILGDITTQVSSYKYDVAPVYPEKLDGYVPVKELRVLIKKLSNI